MSKFILAVDAGTTSNRAILFNHEGKIERISAKEFEQIFPQNGWVEHNPEEIWATQKFVIRDVIKKHKINASDINAIGITNQRETTIVWDRETSEPIYNAIVWQDRRTAKYCDELKDKGLTKKIHEKTGLLIDAYFSASKIKWILDNVEGAREKAEQGKLAFGTVDSWLIWRLTHGNIHATDVTNASRTMLYNIHELKWDKELLDIFEIPESLLPEVKQSSEVYGTTVKEHFGGAIKISGIIGDQQGALFGQMCIEKGMTKNTYGTGCFVVMNTGTEAIISKNNLLTTIAWQLNDEVNYALEGSIFMGGAVIQWLRDQLQIISRAPEVESLALSVPDNGGVVLIPAFVGLGAPHWDQYATGTIIGLTRGTGKAHIARAALESIALQSMDVIKTMTEDSGIDIIDLRVDGGAATNDLLMQTQSDLIEQKVVRPAITETTALGAAYMAGLATGFWSDVDEIQKLWSVDKVFEPKENSNTDQLIVNWNKGLERAKHWNK
ncbi:glycerol kinase GlpK [Marinigracilibium pacificum]|uniref:Glycerol kinase n=1 Tax=Marinigracilibium pacificum TaxID=2729599 RepID=A0A848J0Q2_9BACT|nr:glycerol kinase GlpK [Marinigracilibium pacificum]NMM48938.1 glycerol kinase GlpK [Marinigracilibium pacificum]